jgi:hypothetical protein
MDWKKFLKQDWRKIVVFVVLFIISVPIPSMFNLFSNFETRYPVYAFGVPFGFFYISPVVELAPEIYFDFIGLFGNIIIWYVLSCFIVRIYDKLKKR